MPAWRRFNMWYEQLGKSGLLRIETLARTHIILNTAEAAKALLNKRAGIYADRARSPFMTELVEGSMVLANIHNNPDGVKRRRELLHEIFKPQAVVQWQTFQIEEAQNLARMLLDRPDDHVQCIKESQRALILRETYSDALKTPSSKVWGHVDNTGSRVHPSIAPWLGLFPVLRHWPGWLPGGGWKAIGGKWHKEDRQTWEGLTQEVKDAMTDGKAEPGFLTNLYESKAPERYRLSDLEISFILGNLLTAGGDLPDYAIRIFIMAMILHPHIYATVQAELDAHVSSGRLPTFEDKGSLPYLRAVIMEGQRWRPLSPIGITHLCTEENEWEGMRIPKNALIHPNIWLMSRDPSIYHSPSTFDPTRFLNSDNTINRKHEHPAFGFGKRMCPAAALSEQTVFINVAMLAWAFDLVPPSDGQGGVKMPDVEEGAWMDRWNGVLAVTPPPCDVTFRARSKSREALIRGDYAHGFANDLLKN